MPVLGIIASQISGHLWAPSGAYDSIATTTVGSGGASSVTFSSIPATYKHLQIRAFYLGSNNPFLIQSDLGIGTKSHILVGTGSTTYAYAYNALASKGMYIIDSGNGMSTTLPSVAVVDILDYANTSKNKTWRSLSGNDTNGGGAVQLSSGFWDSTTAITSLTLNFNSTGTFSQYSSFALYGIKGA